MKKILDFSEMKEYFENNIDEFKNNRHNQTSWDSEFDYMVYELLEKYFDTIDTKESILQTKKHQNYSFTVLEQKFILKNPLKIISKKTSK